MPLRSMSWNTKEGVDAAARVLEPQEAAEGEEGRLGEKEMPQANLFQMV